MGMHGFTQLSIGKVDIERAEALLFDNSCRRWIGCVDHIAIELHDDSSFGMASPVFWRAALDAGFEFARSGELLLCHRR